MPELVFKVAGFLLAHLPEPLLRAGAAMLGDLVFFGFPRRRRLVLSNLHHAFPDRSPAWHRAVGRASCRRLIETGLLSLALPALSERRLRIMIRPTPELEAALAGHRDGEPRPTVFATAHLCCWEAQTVMPLLVPAPFPEFGVIFRPLDNPAADAWVKRTRERFGMRLLSRKQGFQEAMRILRRRGCIGLLFDQNAGMQGALTTLFGRMCSTSELPGLLVERFAAELYALYPRRTGFWRVELSVRHLARGGPATAATLALNCWLETHLRADDETCSSWLWAHDRWRNQDVPSRRLRLDTRRNLLDDDLRWRGLATVPRRTRLWVRLPNWLGDVVMSLPLLRAIRCSRPDAEITLLVQPQFKPLLESAGVADRVRPLPPRGSGYFRHFRKLRAEFPDCFVLFTHSLRGDLEARLTGCRQRFGVERPGRRRPLLSQAWRVPAALAGSDCHQLQVWEAFLRHFGLAVDPDRSPWPGLAPRADAAAPLIGLIAGSEHDPAKRWPVRHWRRLIERLAATHPELRFCLFGTASDQPVTDAITLGLNAPIENLAGRTDLPAFAARLAGCRLLVTNDTGGMHLGNALGVPVVALFGPTNPLRTGPVYAAPKRILQPRGCPPAGGGNLADLDPAEVIAAVDGMLNSTD